MGPLEQAHGAFVASRRVQRLADLVSPLLPPGARVLDLGCGDGRLARRILEGRPDLSLEGLDVLVRPDAAIPVRAFDGVEIPCPDGAVDVVLLVDVLHHARNPLDLLREAGRASRQAIVMKDHVADGALDRWQLRFMDEVGNRRFGVDLRCDYWSWVRWRAAWAELRLEPVSLQRDLRLYPGVLDWLFGRGLHFLARLETFRALPGPGA